MPIVNGRRRLTDTFDRRDGSIHKGKPTHYTVEEVKEALREACGNYSGAARILRRDHGRGNIRASGVMRYIRKNNLYEFVNECHGYGKELAADNIVRCMSDYYHDKNQQASQFFIRHIGKNAKAETTYSNVQEISGPGGAPIQTTDVPYLNLDALSEKEVQQLEAVLAKAAGGEHASSKDSKRGPHVHHQAIQSSRNKKSSGKDKVQTKS